MTRSLMSKTLELLREDERSIPEVYAELVEAGVEDITYYWLRKFSSGGFKDPSVNKVQRLYEHLSGNTLLV